MAEWNALDVPHPCIALKDVGVELCGLLGLYPYYATQGTVDMLTIINPSLLIYSFLFSGHLFLAQPWPVLLLSTGLGSAKQGAAYKHLQHSTWNNV
jgi:hypothetical protein